MRKPVRTAIKRVLGRLGYRIAPLEPPPAGGSRPCPDGAVRTDRAYAMTTPECVAVLTDAVRHVVAEDVSGAVVECGVWRGGSMMAVGKTLLELGKAGVDLYLLDTFDGMTDPTERDRDQAGRSAESPCSRRMRHGRVLPMGACRPGSGARGPDVRWLSGRATPFRKGSRGGDGLGASP
jgi:hypothetical protein